ncbi:MAG: DUF2088 domain-containing protein [Spirochaetales bacterium]|nr:DUF2088 domain-containing protein [Spirochaetales bacterium]
MFERYAKENTFLLSREVKEFVFKALSSLGKRKKVLVIPPDISRYPSRAGEITQYIYDYYEENLFSILPATGLHAPMNKAEIRQMFGTLPVELFHQHDPVTGVGTLGHIPGGQMEILTNGLWNSPWPCQVNKLLYPDNYDLIISIGQVVPHEVAGMSNYDKNLFIGTGGREGIDISHYISALYGIENTLGKIDTPVRRILGYASEHFLKKQDILYILTVIKTDPEGNSGIKGLFTGNDAACFFKAAQFSQKENITYVEKPVQKMVVYLDPLEYKSTWLGNKAIYRTRMAIKQGGELVIIAPGISSFGEVHGIDVLIRKYGYSGTETIKKLVHESPDLRSNLAVAAHLIHGSTDKRFLVTLCPGKMSKEEVEGVSFRHGNPVSMLKKYNPERLSAGYNIVSGGEEIYFIQQPGLGLWTTR